MAYDPYGYPRQRRPQSPAPYGGVYGRPARQPVVPGPPSPASAPGQRARARRGQPPPPEPARRPSRWPFLVLAAAFLVLAGGVWTAYSRALIFKDSGIKACETLRDGTRSLTGVARSTAKMTEPQYRQMRKVFEDSRYGDIRDHGTKLMDVIWAMSQATETGGGNDSAAVTGSALVYLPPLGEHLTGLQSACADQGIIINLRQTE
ncbi:hypothetical protein ODJ79_20510 [Actinoplanes sp. KI2]|uniref:hypothetical protein n=1 Tax=Actinoplanes sp. KI2 TaxID=2983315 RepID=UPI0021D5C941|nr:hypothetical protein [Actinoplanes sp. KI2]MCU7726115.1 hypothetical protein [Actinoplanes sp. KI2]